MPDQLDPHSAFDKAAGELRAPRAGMGQDLVQAGDSIGLILESPPGARTATGADGTLTFHLSPGTRLEGAAYGHPMGSGTVDDIVWHDWKTRGVRDAGVESLCGMRDQLDQSNGTAKPGRGDLN